MKVKIAEVLIRVIIILNIFAVVACLLAIVALDSNSNVPVAVIGVSVVWLTTSIFLKEYLRRKND